MAQYLITVQILNDERNDWGCLLAYGWLGYNSHVLLYFHYYQHYSFVKDLQIILCIVLGRKMAYAEGRDIGSGFIG